MIPSKWRAIATAHLFWFLPRCLNRQNLLQNMNPRVRDAPHAASINALRKYLLPCVIFRLLIFPALSSLRGRSPAQDTNAATVANRLMSAPISEMMMATVCSLMPGMLNKSENAR